MRTASNLLVTLLAIAAASCERGESSAVSASASDAPAQTKESEIPLAARASDLSRIWHATTFAELRSALMSTYPKISDVKWYPPTKDDPKPLLEITLSSDAAAKREDLLRHYHEIAPQLMKTKVPWGTLNLSNPTVLILDRSLARDVGLSTINYDEAQELSMRSGQVRRRR